MADPILVAKKDAKECFLLPDKANRHGLITGATGTGKTITLQRMGEAFSRIGVPVFMADIKEWPAMNEVYTTFFPADPPARSAVAGSGLALGARVEIECMAVAGR